MAASLYRKMGRYDAELASYQNGEFVIASDEKQAVDNSGGCDWDYIKGEIV